MAFFADTTLSGGGALADDDGGDGDDAGLFSFVHQHCQKP